MNISTPRCIIRNLTATDAPCLHKILSDRDVMEYIEPPFTIEQTREFIQTAGSCDPPLVYALIWKDTETLIGHVIFHPCEENSMELGWILQKSFWGLGIASEVTEALTVHAKKKGAKSCVIRCDPRQNTSKNIALRNHFRYEGQEDGCLVYRLILQ